MALKFPDRLESNNPNAYGIAKSNQISGHKSVSAVTNLYTISDAILSDSGNNTENDALGQRWYVVAESCYYELINWANRKAATGWKKINSDTVIQNKLNEKVDKISGKSLVADTEITKLTELPNKTTLDSQINTAKQAGTTAQTNLTTHSENKTNPHGVTKAQVGLSNVDNTSDVNKPISKATQTALDKKLDEENITEYNVSKRHPTSGSSKSNKYSLQTAIQLIPENLKYPGIKCTFINDSNNIETWVWKGGEFTSISTWISQEAKKFSISGETLVIGD